MAIFRRKAEPAVDAQVLDEEGLAHPLELPDDSSPSRQPGSRPVQKGWLWSRFSTRDGATGAVIEELQNPGAKRLRDSEYTGD